MSDQPTGGGGGVSPDEALQSLDNIEEGETLLGVKSTRKPYIFCFDHLIDHKEMSRRVKGMLFSKIVCVPNFQLNWPWFYPPHDTALPSLVRTNNAADEVWGVLYNAEFADVKELEKSIRVPTRYHKRQLHVIDRGGRRITAAAYVLSVSSEGDCQPSPAYMEKLISGAAERGIPQQWIETLRSIPTGKPTA